MEKKPTINELREKKRVAIAELREKKRAEKIAARLELEKTKTVQVPSCYCRGTITADILLKKIIKPDKSQNPEAPDMPKFKSEDHERKYIEAINAPNSRCSKSGFLRCANRQTCVLGGFFHVVCCYNEEPKFDLKKKAREKWFCLKCREKQINEAPKLKETKVQSPTKAKESPKKPI